ncbi:MAG: hypothetical protein MI747_22970 [Desulfobacterales bacterium]|nr:hypothetical protein [Desulfobacterales bacterium]
MADRYFIDPHCHFFNIDDIPIIPTATAQLPVNSILVLGLFFKKATLKALDRFKPFIQFFENNRQSNLESHVSGIWETIDPAQFQGVILTPLIMDFSLIEESRENLGDQTEKLVNAIQKVDSQLQAQRAKVFPFLGMDLRHFNHCTNSQQVAHRIRELSLDHLDPAAYQHPGLSQVGGMENGTILGIKLYPPIGFSPFPDNPAHRRGSQ